MKRGQRVSHPAFGTGVVLAVNLVGSQKRANVDFGYAQPWIVLDTLQVLSEEEGGATSFPTPAEANGAALLQPLDQVSGRTFDAGVDETVWSGAPTLTKSQTEARKGIVALRLGQILENQALQLSVGTEALQRKLREALTHALGGQPTFVLIDGTWGGGKTHALTLLQALAREQRMAIGGAVMDGVAVTLSEPMRLLESIISSLRIPGNASGDGLGQLLRTAKIESRSPSLRTRGAHEVANALDSLPPRAFDDPQALQCIEDYFSFALSATQVRTKLHLLGYEAAALPILMSRGVDERPRGFAALLRCWSQTLAVMGTRGLLVVLDELDVEYASTAYANRASWGLRARRRALFEQIKGLSVHNAPLLIAFASAPAGPDVATENDAVEDVRGAIGDGLIHIKATNPSEEHLKQLLARLTSLYETAYPDKTLGILGQEASALFAGLHARYRRAPNPVPRHFVRSALEAFDLLTVGEQSFGDVMRLLKASD